MRCRVRVHPGGGMPVGTASGQRVTSLLGTGVFGRQEPSLQTDDQILHRTALTLGGADHSANPPGLGLLTALLISLEGRAIGGQVSVELLTLRLQHFPEMLSLKAIGGLRDLVSQIRVAR